MPDRYSFILYDNAKTELDKNNQNGITSHNINKNKEVGKNIEVKR